MTEKESQSINQKCPQCGASDWAPLGTPGYAGRGVLIVLFGFLGAMIANANAKKNAGSEAFVCKCASCKAKWTATPQAVPMAERLEQPCEISLTRPGGFVGAAVSQFVYLNGIRAGVLKNNSTVNFQTNVKHNILFVTDASGTVFKDIRRFDAEPGENKSFSFNRKFL